MTRMTLARGLSIIGHPVLVMLVATLLAARASGTDAASMRRLVIGVGALGGAVLAYSLIQVRSGRWLHVDASRRDERLHLNVVLLVVLAATATWAVLRGGWSPLALALAAAAAIVATALLSAPWLKLSLHVAFALFAAFLPGPRGGALAFVVLAAALAWSRLALARHSRRDVLAGALAGAAAGWAFRTF